MRWLLNFIRNLFGGSARPSGRGRLLGMYFDENNSGRTRKPNRERA